MKGVEIMNDERMTARLVVRVIRELTEKNYRASIEEILSLLDIDVGDLKDVVERLKSMGIISIEGNEIVLSPREEDDFLLEVIIDILQWLGPMAPKDLADFVHITVGKKYKKSKIMSLANQQASYKRFIRRRTVWIDNKKRDVYALITQMEDIGKRVSMYSNPRLREKWRKMCEYEIIGSETQFEYGEKSAEHLLEGMEERPKTMEDFIEHIKSQPWYREQIVFAKDIPMEEARYGKANEEIDERIVKVLKKMGIRNLYIHQCEAIELYLKKENFVITTPNASGKTLCYLIPILNEMLKNEKSRFMYLAPTKALEQDQLRRLRQILVNFEYNNAAEICDGDTPMEMKKRIMKNVPRILLTNPDTLHYMLRDHDKWKNLFKNLKIIVIDEMHIYIGVFGSHVANIFRRLNAVCKKYGTELIYMCASATIGNPRELAEKLTDKKFKVISVSGAPTGPKKFIFWNPFVNSTEGSSAYGDATNLFKEHIKHGIKVILFARARKSAEIIHQRAKNDLAHDVRERIATYRAGYLPQDRRKIERGMSHGNLLGITATSALELGIDIGNLDATILMGYPGTISSTWQQANRAGRREEEALVTLIALADPLNQYLIRNPSYIFEKTPEHAVIDPMNKYISEFHSKCMEYEISKFEDAKIDKKIISPHRDVGIRTISSNTYEIYDDTKKRRLGFVEEIRAFKSLHEGAVYLHQGDTYIVTRLDKARGRIYVRLEDVPYYTETLRRTTVSVKEVFDTRDFGRSGTEVGYGEVNVREDILGYVEIDAQSGDVIGKKDVFMPPISMDTEAMWIKFPNSVEKSSDLKIDDGLHAIVHTTISMMPLIALCSTADFSGAYCKYHPNLGAPSIFIYDSHPGGIGISKKGFERSEELLQMSLKAIKSCKCQDGCPMCIQSPICGFRNENIDKKSAIILLECVLSDIESFQI